MLWTFCFDRRNCCCSDLILSLSFFSNSSLSSSLDAALAALAGGDIVLSTEDSGRLLGNSNLLCNSGDGSPNSCGGNLDGMALGFSLLGILEDGGMI